MLQLSVILRFQMVQQNLVTHSAVSNKMSDLTEFYELVQAQTTDRQDAIASLENVTSGVAAEVGNAHATLNAIDMLTPEIVNGYNTRIDAVTTRAEASQNGVSVTSSNDNIYVTRRTQTISLYM